MAGRIARRVVVTGRVQGVFFRASTRDHARHHGLVGWVRNRPDGAVEAHLEGSADGIEQVVEWMRAGGPAQAVVDRVDEHEVSAEGGRDFIISD